MTEGRNLINPQKYFANYRVSLNNSKFVLAKKNAIYLFIYRINVMARMILTSICGEGV